LAGIFVALLSAASIDFFVEDGVVEGKLVGVDAYE
jgi:hypothetical protein